MSPKVAVFSIALDPNGQDVRTRHESGDAAAMWLSQVELLNGKLRVPKAYRILMAARERKQYFDVRWELCMHAEQPIAAVVNEDRHTGMDVAVAMAGDIRKFMFTGPAGTSPAPAPAPPPAPPPVTTGAVGVKSRQADRLSIGTRKPVHSLVLASPRHVAAKDYTPQYFGMACVYLIMFGVMVDGVESKFIKYGHTMDLYTRLQAHLRELANVSVAPGNSDDRAGEDGAADDDGSDDQDLRSNAFFELYAVIPTVLLERAKAMEDFIEEVFAAHLVTGLVHGTGKKRGKITEVLAHVEPSEVEQRVLVALDKLGTPPTEQGIELLNAQAMLALAESKRLQAEANKIRAETERMQVERGGYCALATSAAVSCS